MPHGATTASQPAIRPGPTALYAQVASIMRSQIASGAWAPEQSLPAIEDLCERYGVSRITVRQAIGMLAAEGLLVSRRGRRVTVAKRIVPSQGQFHDIVDATVTPDDHEIVVLAKERRATVAPELCFIGKPVPAYVRISKIHKAGGVPYCVMDVLIDQRIFDRWPRGIERRAKLAPLLLDSKTVRIARARERIVVAAADFDEAKWLDYPMAGPVARMTRVMCDEADNAVYFGRFTYRGDRFGVEREHGPYVRQPWDNMRARRARRG